MSISSSTKEEISLKKFKEKVINDFRTISLSREISVQGRREVLLGKGKFGLVKTAIHKKTGKRVAVKVMSKTEMTV